MKFAKLSLLLTARNGHMHTFTWLAADEQDNRDDLVCVRLHIDEYGQTNLSGKTKIRILSVGKSRQSRKTGNQLLVLHR